MRAASNSSGRDAASDGFALGPQWKRPDSWCILAVTALAAVPRFWLFGELGLNHFDEGAYAMSARAVALGDLPEGLYPLQHFLSPPFFFLLVSAGMRLFDPAADWVVLGTSAVLGVATVPLVFLVGRHWAGREAGLAAALLLAFSDFHIALSRVGLTDVTFAFVFVLALWAYTGAEERESWRLAVMAGVATGLAWNTKYHGWLATAVAAVALLPVIVRSDRRRAVRKLARVALAAFLAFLIYAPWALYVTTQEGGYARLAAEHGRFLQPASAWQSAVWHLRAQMYMDGWLSRIALPLSLLGATAISRGLLPSIGPSVLVTAAILLATACWIGAVGTITALAMLGGWLLVRGTGHGRWIALAFFVTFTALTPLYRPYSRLLVPWMIAVMLMAGTAVARLAGGTDVTVRVLRYRGMFTALAFGLTGLSVAISVQRYAPSPYLSSRGMAEAANRLVAIVPPEAPISVIGEPAVVFYLRAHGRQAWHYDRPQQLYKRFAPGDTIFVVGGIYSRRAKDLTRLADQLPTAYYRLATIPITAVNHVRLLDDFGPSRAGVYLRSELPRPVDRYDLEVFRVVLP
jgi:dolichyl-phosphate-mannose-protein mannosyltransferase